MVDESLIKQTIAADKLQKVTVRRLISMIESAAETGVDGVLVTCSSIGPAVSFAAKLFSIPVIRADEAMAEKAAIKAAAGVWLRCAPRWSRRSRCCGKRARPLALPPRLRNRL